MSDGALTLTGTFQLGGSARGKAADVSPDGSALLATNPLGCTSRWELVADSAPSIGCGDISESLLATTVLSENETATLGWSGTSAGAVRFDASTWTPTQTLGGFRTDLLTRGSSAFVAVGEDQLTVLNDPPASVLMATSGEIRGAVVVPCAP